jgi:threonine aldolase
MLMAIQNTTLFDDGYGQNPATSSLEVHMAELYNHEVGVFLLSGAIGNQIALRTLLTQPPHSVLSGHQAHILCLEAGGVSMLRGTMVEGVVLPFNDVVLLKWFQGSTW